MMRDDIVEVDRLVSFGAVGVRRRALMTGVHVASGRSAVVTASEASILQVARMLRRGEHPLVVARGLRIA